MLVIIILGVILFIIGVFYLYEFSVEKYDYDPLTFEDEYGWEILAIVCIVLAGIFDFFAPFTKHQVNWAHMNLNSFVLIIISAFAFIMRVRSITIKTNIFIGISFGVVRILLIPLLLIIGFLIFYP